MLDLFKYNWKIREESFDQFSKFSEDVLLQERTGGVGSILKTFFHIIDVECSWIQAIHDDEISEPDYEQYQTLDLVRELSNHSQEIVSRHLLKWTPEDEFRFVSVPWSSDSYYYGEVIRHVIAHEIHHIGQLSIWSRELGFKPVNVNYIGRGFMEELRK